MRLRKHSHEDRIRIAEQLRDKIVKEYGNKTIAVCIWGSTAKSLDRPFSDLEMLTITVTESRYQQFSTSTKDSLSG